MTGTAPTPAEQELSLEQLLHATVEDWNTIIQSDDRRRVTISGCMAQCMQTLSLDYLTRVEATYPLMCLHPGMTHEDRGRLLMAYQKARGMAVLVHDILDHALRQ